MPGGADGSIIIDTELDNTGFKHGTQQLENSVKSFIKTVNSIGGNLSGNMQQVVSNLQTVGQQTQEIQRSMFQAPAMNGFEKSLNSIQRQAASLQAQLQRMGDSVAQGFKTDNQMIRFQTQVQHAQERLQTLQGIMNTLGGQTIDTPEFTRLTSEIGKAEQALFRLYNRRDIMAELGTDQASVGWQRLAIQIRNAEEELARLERDRDRMVAEGSASVMGVDVTQYQALQATLQELTASLAQYQEVAAGFNVIQQPAQESTEALESVDNELQQKSTDANQAKTGMSGFGQALASVSGFVRQTASDLASLSFKAITTGAKAAGNAVKTMWRGIATGAKTAGQGISSLIGKLKSLHSQSSKNTLTNNGLVKSLTSVKRMLLSRIKRTFISYLFNAIRQSMNELSSYSSTFSASMAEMKNSFSGLSGNIAVAAGNLVSAIVPAIATICDWISRAISLLNAFFALLSGRGVYTVAKRGMDEYTDSLKGGGGAAKALNDQLYGFDELNRADSDSGGGGGGGGSSDLGFEEESIETLPAALREFMQSIIDAFNAEQFEQVGALIASGLNTIITTVDDWIVNTLRPFAVEWSERIARILNGLVGGFDGKEAGKTVGDGVNTVLETLNKFLTTFDFDALGTKFAESVNGLFATVDWDLLGETVANRFNGVIDLLSGAITNAGWDDMAADIADGINGFLKGVNWSKLILTAWIGVKSIFLLINDVIQNIQFDEWTTEIGKGLNGIFDKAEWTEIGKSVSNSFNNIIGGLDKFIQEDIPWDSMAESIAAGANGLFDNVEWDKLLKTVWGGFLSIVGACLLAISLMDFAGWTEDIAKGVNGLFDKAEWTQLGEDVSEGFNNIIEALEKGMKLLKWDTMAESIGAGANALLSNIDWSSLVYTVMFGILSLVAAFWSAVPLIDFKKIGEDIAAGLNRVFSDESIDWAKIGDDFGTSFVHAIEGVTAYLEKVDWYAVGSAIETALANIPWGAIVTSLSGLISQALHSALELVFGKDIADLIVSPEFLDSWKNETKRLLGEATNDVQEYASGLGPIQVGGKKFVEVEAVRLSIMDLFDSVNTAIDQGAVSSSAKIALAVQAIALGYGDKLAEVEPTLAQQANGFMQAIADAGTSNKWLVVNAFQSIGLSATDSLIEAVMNGQIPVETAVMGLAHGMNEEMLLSVTDEELMSQITDFYKEIGESAGSALGEAAVSSADQGVVSGIDALESKADDLVESLDIQDQQHTLETDNKDTAEAGMQAVGEGVENGTPDIQTAAEEAVEAVKSPFEDLPEATQAQALLMMQAIQAAIASGEPEATAAIAVAAQAVVTRAAQIMNEGEGQKIGKAFLDAIKKGVKAGQEALVTTSKTVAMAVKAAFDSILSTSAGSNIGAQICNGIVSGIQSGSSHIANAARNAARAALNAAQAALGIHSPSKAFEDVGSYMMQGMEIGLNDGRRDVTRTVSNIAHGIVDGLSDTPSVQLAADTLVTGLDGTVERLSDVAHMFQSIADSITAIGGLNVPAVASGAFTPYKVRVSDTGGLESTFTDMAHDLRRLASDRNEDSSDTRSLIRELIRVVQNLDLTVDGPSLERALTSLHRNRLQTYGY